MTLYGQAKCAVVCMAMALLSNIAGRADERIDLAGAWNVRLDPRGMLKPEDGKPDVGQTATVQLPGALRDAGLGEVVGPNTRWIGTVRAGIWEQPKYAPYYREDHFKVPFWLQPSRHYVGVAWYQRSVQIPNDWSGKRILLRLERPHWQTQVFVDGQAVGDGDSLSTAHVFDLTPQLDPGQHSLMIRVDNSLDTIDVGLNSHSVSDHTQTAWHGVVGKIELYTEPFVTFDTVQVHPAEDARSARIHLRWINQTDSDQTGLVQFSVRQREQLLGQSSQSVRIPLGRSEWECEVAFQQVAARWDEFDPQLCELEVTLKSEPGIVATRRLTFGIRHLETAGRRWLLNGRPLFLRGTLECCIFPLTGYPPCDVASWERIITVCKAHGLNHIRFHSWCPPEAAFVAADELGFYYQVECSTWPNGSTALGVGRPIDGWLYQEADRILDAYGNHPSFLLLAAGNEPAGPGQGGQYLGPWVKHFRARDDRRLVTAGAGWPSIVENEFHVTPAPRIQQWGQGVESRINARPPETETDYRQLITQYDVPVVSHEIGQWCVFPNFEEIPKYTGALKPRNFEIFRDLLEQAHMLDQARDFLMASGKLQTLCYKEEIESALRTPEFGGFQLLDLHDFPGQGTALVGILDPFWDSKPYVRPVEFQRFCNAVVPLARLPRRIWTDQQTLVAEIEVAQFGPVDLPGAGVDWRLRGAEIEVNGSLPSTDLPSGVLSPVGRIEVPLAQWKRPTPLSLEVTLRADGQQWANDWDLWVYPQSVQLTPPADVKVMHDVQAVNAVGLAGGAKVLLLADPATVKGDVSLGFSPIFWNTAWTEGQPPQTLGILCDPQHPVMAEFPTDYHSNWQWWELVTQAQPMVLDNFPSDLRPLVQVVPDWFAPQRLALLFEARVGKGKLLVCSVDLRTSLSERPVARQLLHSLLQYMHSAEFSPRHELTIDQLRGLFREPAR